MSIFDWNGNGEHDIFDDLLEYKIFEDFMKEDEEDNDSVSDEWESDDFDF